MTVASRYGEHCGVGHRQVSEEVAKVGDWKTIDQREMLARRARKTKRHGYAAAGVGAGAAAAAVARGGEQRIMGELRSLGDYARYGARTAHWPGGKPRLLRLAGEAVSRNPYGAAVAGGATLAAGGLGWAGQGKVRETYHHHKINDRRRANRRPVSKADRQKFYEAKGDRWQRADENATVAKPGDAILRRSAHDRTGRTQAATGMAGVAGGAGALAAAPMLRGRGRVGAAAAGGAAVAGGLGLMHRSGSHRVTEVHNLRTNRRYAVTGSRFHSQHLEKALIPTSTMSALRPAAAQTSPAATPLPPATKPIAQPKGKLQATGVKTKTTPVTKAQRRKVYEADRQRRIGIGIGGATAAGALLAHRGLRGAMLTSRLARDGAKFTANQAGLNAPVKAKVMALRARGVAATPKDAAQIAGGGALLATAGGQAHYARSRRNREWT